MKLIMKENKFAEQIINDKDLGAKPFESLVLVSRYYLDTGHTKKQVRVILNSFLVECKPDASIVKWSDTLDRALAMALKRPAVYIESIPITNKEMEKISKLTSKQAKRLAFTLLCLEKFMLIMYKDKYEYGKPVWIGVKDSDIMAYSNISTSIKRQGIIYKELIDAGFIILPRVVDAVGVYSCMSEGGSTVLEVTDLRNLGYQYLMYCGEKYFKCCNCGITTKQNNENCRKKQKYCKNCAHEVYIKQTVNSVMMRRKKEAHSSDAAV